MRYVIFLAAFTGIGFAQGCTVDGQNYTCPVSFTYQLGDPVPASQEWSLTAAAGTNSLSLSPISQPWLHAVLSSFSTPATLYISVNPAGLAVGTYTGNFEVTSSTASNDLFFLVTLTIAADTSSLTFNAVAGGAAPPAQTVVVGSDSPGQMIFQDTTNPLPGWLVLPLVNIGSTPFTLRVSVNPAGLTPGTYTAYVPFFACNGVCFSTPPDSWTVKVTLVVPAPAPPALTVSTNQMSFQCSEGNSIVQSLSVLVSTTRSQISTTITSSAPWLSTLPPGNATAPFTLSVQPVCTGMAVGNFTGTVVIQDTSLSSDSQTINVALTVGKPVLTITDVTNAALPGLDTPPSTLHVASRSMATIFGTGLADTTASSLSPWALFLGGTEVHFASDTCFGSSCDLLAKLIYVSPTQINFLVPTNNSTTPVSYRLIFVRDGQRVDDQNYMLGGPGRIVVDPTDVADANVVFQIGYDCLFSASLSDGTACGLSWSSGHDRVLVGAVTDAITGQLITTQNPVYQGRLVTLWMTAVAGGMTLSANTGLMTANTFSPVTFGVAQNGQDLTTTFTSPVPLWVGESPQFVGLDQDNVYFPTCANAPVATTEKRYDAFLTYTNATTNNTARIYMPFDIRPGDPDCHW